MDPRQDYYRDVEARLRQLDLRIGDLRQRLDRAGHAQRGPLRTRLVDLEQRRAVIEDRLTAMRAASDSEWEQHRGALDGLTQDVEDAVQGAFLNLT